MSPKDSTARRSLEDAAYYAEFVRRELEMLDQEPLNEVTSDEVTAATPSKDPLEMVYVAASQVLDKPLDDDARRYLSGLFCSMGLGLSEFTEMVRRAATFVREGHRWFGAVQLAGM